MWLICCISRVLVCHYCIGIALVMAWTSSRQKFAKNINLPFKLPAQSSRVHSRSCRVRRKNVDGPMLGVQLSSKPLQVHWLVLLATRVCDKLEKRVSCRREPLRQGERSPLHVHALDPQARKFRFLSHFFQPRHSSKRQDGYAYFFSKWAEKPPGVNRVWDVLSSCA